jgi:predicted nucleic acid-binding protein
VFKQKVVILPEFRVFLDADIFIDLLEKEQEIRTLLHHLTNKKHVLITSLTVMGELVLVCKRDGKDLHKIIDLFDEFDIRFVIPNEQLRSCCMHLDEIDVANWIPYTDKTHLAYAIANDATYFLTTDKKLQKFDLNDCDVFSKDKIVSPEEIRRLL